MFILQSQLVSLLTHSGALQDALQGEVVPRLRHWLTQGNDAWNEDS